MPTWCGSGEFSRATVVLLVWIVTAVMAALYLAGAIFRELPRRAIPLTQRGFAAGCVVIALVLARGLQGKRLGELESFLPPPEGAVTEGIASVNGELPWMVNDYSAGLARAKAEGQDGADRLYGLHLHELSLDGSEHVSPRTEITDEMSKFVRVRLYTDGQGELYRTQQKLELDKFGTVACRITRL